MKSPFIREQKRYSFKEICLMLECDEDKATLLIRKLKEYGVMKMVKASANQKDMSDLADDDIEVTDVRDDTVGYYYVFTYVGVIMIMGYTIKCYPKYLLHTSDSKENRKELAQILKVLDKFDSKKQLIKMLSDNTNSASYNWLALTLFLLNDYFEYGVYSNTKEIVEINGTGEILWDRTVNETFPIVYNNRPYYTELQTRKKINDERDLFKRLHQIILTSASRGLYQAGLAELFDIATVYLSDKDLEELGEQEYLLYQIENELNVQFNTRKQMVLRALHVYISHIGQANDVDSIYMIGTNSFHIIWEKVCAFVLGNALDTKLYKLNTPKPIGLVNRKLNLQDVIEKPLWTITGQTASKTLIPDLIAISEEQFIIFDAKYYTPTLIKGKPPLSQPGIESIIKQYMYQLAYKKFIAKYGFISVKNCFLMPTESNKVISKGTVVMKMLEDIGLENIIVRFVPASLIYDLFLSGEQLDIDLLNL
ncbi:LlaJI family restriction endonuclease [Selenomonas ruminantium]|uniref:LlaJI restriction endonuclease n=1 Tax=Selenomonas ruminantium TaxID=971 RepID=A0A1K1M646_SELRU|nr:LlaJI family restriction endonuclease [Selenomonas ruminantium]SFW18553.1 LlaJI restriction endonuclease [Selenomonas ruminantium]